MAEIAAMELVAYILFGLLALGSLLVWQRTALKLQAGEPLLPLQSRPDDVWDPIAAFVAAVWVFEQLRVRIFIGIREEPVTIELSGVQQSCMVQLLLLGLLLSILAWSRRFRLADFGINLRRPYRQAIDGALGFLASCLPVYAVLLVTQALQLRTPETQHSFLKFLEANRDVTSVAWITLSVVIVAPLVEELVFRLVLQGTLQVFIPPSWAIVLVAVLFSTVHGWPDSLPLFSLALVLGYVYYRRNSYLAVVVLHAIFNGTNLVFALLLPLSETGGG